MNFKEINIDSDYIENIINILKVEENSLILVSKDFLEKIQSVTKKNNTLLVRSKSYYNEKQIRIFCNKEDKLEFTIVFVKEAFELYKVTEVIVKGFKYLEFHSAIHSIIYLN